MREGCWRTWGTRETNALKITNDSSDKDVKDAQNQILFSDESQGQIAEEKDQLSVDEPLQTRDFNHNRPILIVMNQFKTLLDTSKIKKITFPAKSLKNTTSISNQKQVKVK